MKVIEFQTPDSAKVEETVKSFAERAKYFKGVTLIGIDHEGKCFLQVYASPNETAIHAGFLQSYVAKRFNEESTED